MIRDLVGRAVEKCPEGVHIEARYHHHRNTQIRMDKGRLERANVDDFAGIGIRVLVDGAWGYASTSKIDSSAVDEALADAVTAARTLAKTKKDKITLAPIKPVTGSFESRGKDPFENHRVEEAVGIVKEMDARARGHDKRISGCLSWVSEGRSHKIIMNSDGTDVELKDSRPMLFLRAIAAEGSKIVPAAAGVGITGGWEIFKQKPPLELADRVADFALRLLDAPFPKGGKQTIVMEPGVVGLIAHEAIGHTVEADFVMSGSAAKGKIGKKVASDQVTLIDSGEQDYGAGWIPVDDAGVEAKKTVIIEKGMMRSYLHSRHSAHHFGVEPTGNERAFEYDVEPLIRMRNTYLEPGNLSHEEVLEGIDFGYLCVEPGGGQADSSAEFMFQIPEAYEIVKGEIGRPVRDLAVTGNAYDVLMSVDAVGRNWKLSMGAGYCGKGQLAKVDGGGGSTRAQALVSGGGA